MVGCPMNFLPTRWQFNQLLKLKYTFIPIVLRVDLGSIDRLRLFKQLYNEPERFLFESGNKGRYTIMGGNPHLIWKNEFSAFRHYMEQQSSPIIEGLPKCVGGAFGFISYDLAWQLEKLPEHAVNDVGYDDSYLFICRDPLIIDEAENILYIVSHLEVDNLTEEGDHYSLATTMLRNRYDEIKTIMATLEADFNDNKDDHTEILGQFRHAELMKHRDAAFEKKDFMEAVNRIQEYIRSGDVFQVNLSVRQEAKLYSDPIDIYRTLRLVNPSPYMGYMEFPDYQLVSCSPELLIKIENGVIETRPIAGTRPRTGNESEDRAKADELINNEKERAEHIMLVDLERNDLGRVCEFGSVEVSEWMVIESYSHVMHIVSHVKGKLAAEEDVFTAIEACFPGGTITGAPKIRTMEIIEECEPVKRGPYTGSMGWIDFNGNLELNILIRTLFVQDGIGYIQAGAGIVIDSIPEQEYNESLRKAEALWRAVELSEKYELSRAEGRVNV